MSIQSVGARLYVTGNTYPIKDQLKALGCHWDADRKQWWIGKAKAAELQQIVDRNSGSAAVATTGYVAPTPAELAQKPCTGKVEYKGRTYYVVGESKTGKLLLTVLDCSISFWAAQSDCRWVKRYEARQQWDGRYRSGRTEMVHQTVGSIRKFIAQSRHDDAEIAAGKIPSGYCVDLEDGMVKRRSECDIPAD